VAFVAAMLLASASARAALPEIRTSAHNQVPACVTPERLMAFLAANNAGLDARYGDIALWYEYHGKAWRVRWDYAFFQMALETNFLAYRRGDGRPGDVDARQNNFAGLGATGGGVPGDSFPDIKTGVLAQIQHLVAYSGQRVADPVSARTALKQDDIISASLKLARPPRFSDLTRRWAADRNYHRSIEAVAERYRAGYCRADGAGANSGSQPASIVAAADAAPQRRQPSSPVRTIWRRGETAQPRTAAAPVPPPPVAAVRKEPADPLAGQPPALDLGERLADLTAVAARAFDPTDTVTAPMPVGCEIETAGTSSKDAKGILVRAIESGRVRYTVLHAIGGHEERAASRFIAEKTENGTIVGSFESGAAALAKASQLCSERVSLPEARTASITDSVDAERE